MNILRINWYWPEGSFDKFQKNSGIWPANTHRCNVTEKLTWIQSGRAARWAITLEEFRCNRYDGRHFVFVERLKSYTWFSNTHILYWHCIRILNQKKPKILEISLDGPRERLHYFLSAHHTDHDQHHGKSRHTKLRTHIHKLHVGYIMMCGRTIHACCVRAVVVSLGTFE